MHPYLYFRNLLLEMCFLWNRLRDAAGVVNTAQKLREAAAESGWNWLSGEVLPIVWWWKIPPTVLLTLLRATSNRGGKKRKGGALPRFMQNVSGHIGSAFALVSLESTAFHWVTPAATAQPCRRRGEERTRRQWHFQLSICWNVTWPRRRRRLLHRKKATLSAWPAVGERRMLGVALEDRMEMVAWRLVPSPRCVCSLLWD